MFTLRTMRSALASPCPAASARLSSRPKPIATIDVTARFGEDPGQVSADDLYDYAYVMQYQVEAARWDKQTILVAQLSAGRPRAEIGDDMQKVVGGSLKRFERGAASPDPDREHARGVKGAGGGWSSSTPSAKVSATSA